MSLVSRLCGHRSGRLLSRIGVVACVAGALAAGPAQPAQSAQTQVRGAAGFTGEVAAALAAAADSGVPVEVTSRRGESSTLFANPEGTMTLESSNVPIRVRQGGSWVPIDPTLVRERDGSVRPRATALSMAMSGGGGAPLVRIVRGGGWLELVAPFALPAPVLTGATATYPEVLPGVDLVVRAGASTFSELFVVKSAEAAANPALTSVRFSTRSSGLTVRSRRDGGIDVVDGRGAAVLTGPAPLLWDSTSTRAIGGVSGAVSSVTPAGAGTSTVSAPAAAAPPQTPAVPQTAAGATVEGNDAQPAEGDRVAAVAVRVSAGAVTLTPDPVVLRGSGTTYPVYLDPTVGATRSGWAMVNKSYPAQEYWQWAGDSSHAEGMGYINDPATGVQTKRLFYQFTTAALGGRKIYGATFRAFETHAYSCTASRVEAWHVATIGSATNWNNQPAGIASGMSGTTPTPVQSSRTVAYGRTGCTPGGSWVDFDVTRAVQYQTTHGGAFTTVMLRAGSETSNSGWKRFQYGATLSVTYNTVPTAPTNARTIEPSTPCVTGAARPVIANDPPKLVARMNDADAGENVTGSFELFTLSGTALTTINNAAAAPNADQVADLAPVYPLPAGMPDGDYKWRVRTKDLRDWGPYSGWCEFTVDGTAPAAPTMAPTTETQAAIDSGQPLPYGGTASFTVSAGDTILQYRYSVNSGVPTSAVFAFATTPTFTVPLTAYGPIVVRVWAYDAAGNQSGTAAESGVIQVGGVDLVRDRRARWRMDESSGTTAADAVGVSTGAPDGANPMTVTGGASWGGGYWASHGSPADGTDRALVLNVPPAVTTATGATVTTNVLDLHLNTTVTAWVNLSSTADRAVAVSHDAAGGASFTLEERPVTVTREDPVTGLPVQVSEPHVVATVRVPGAETVIADAGFLVQADTWYHLAATWAPGTRELTVYVADSDGNAAGFGADMASADVDAAAGVMRVGAARTSAGALAAYWPGVVDEVVVYANVIPAEVISDLLDQGHAA